MPVHVHANCAMSLDGCLGLPGPKPLKLSDAEDLRRVHGLRAASDGILVGIGTVLADDPKLTVKWDLIGQTPGKNPTRVVLDRSLRTPTDSELSRHDAATLLLHGQGATGGPANAQRAAIPTNPAGGLDLHAALAELDRRGIRRLLVEGGPHVLSSFLEEKLIDELTIFVAPILVGLSDAPRLFTGRGPVKLGLRFDNAQKFGEGVVLRFLR